MSVEIWFNLFSITLLSNLVTMENFKHIFFKVIVCKEIKIFQENILFNDVFGTLKKKLKEV